MSWLEGEEKKLEAHKVEKKQISTILSELENIYVSGSVTVHMTYTTQSERLAAESAEARLFIRVVTNVKGRLLNPEN